MSGIQQNFMNQFYREGGKISKIGRPSKLELKYDTVPSILQVGEIVIPRKLSFNHKFLKDLRKFGYDIKTGKFKNK
jgi:hypothetical protein